MLDVIEVSQRVEKGAALLDEKVGQHWSDLVNFQTLHMDSCENCVAAQGTGLTYAEALPILFETRLNWSWTDMPAAHGFALALDDGCVDACDTCEECQEAWDLLQSAWVGLITVRRSRAKAEV